MAYRPFADLLDQAEKLILGPMNREELETTIVCPAERQGVVFEEGLVSRILDDVGDEPGSLPLLEFALTQLWEQQENNRLTHAAYEAIGACVRSRAFRQAQPDLRFWCVPFSCALQKSQR